MKKLINDIKEKSELETIEYMDGYDEITSIAVLNRKKDWYCHFYFICSEDYYTGEMSRTNRCCSVGDIGISPKPFLPEMYLPDNNFKSNYINMKDQAFSIGGKPFNILVFYYKKDDFDKARSLILQSIKYYGKYIRKIFE